MNPKKKACVQCEDCQVAAEPFGGSRYVCKHTGETITARVDKFPACKDFKPPRP